MLMRVLHCITGMTGDGAQRMLLRLTESMSAFGVESSVVNLGEPHGVAHLFERIGVRVWSLSITPTASGALVGARRLRHIVSQTEPDIVQGWMYHANIITFLARVAQRQGPVLLWNIRRGLDDYRQRQLKTRCVIRSNAALSRMIDGVVYCSHESKLQHEQFGFNPKSSAVVENGFDSEKFKPRPESRQAFRRQYGIRDDQIVVGNIGRFDLAKGHTFLIEAFSKVLAVEPKAVLVLIGRGVDESNAELASVLHSCGCRDRVLLLGEQERVEQMIPAFDIYCSASISEGFPNALSEAMACGVVCVATDTGASRQVVGGIGRVVAPRSVEQLAEALIAAIGDGAESRQVAGQYGRERIVTQYALHSVARRYYELYRHASRDKKAWDNPLFSRKFSPL